MLVQILVLHWWEWLSESPILFRFLGFRLGFQSPADTILLTATSAWLAGWEKQSPVSALPIHNNCNLPCSLGTSLHITRWWLRICFAFYFLSENNTTERRRSTCICLNSTFYNKTFHPPEVRPYSTKMAYWHFLKVYLVMKVKHIIKTYRQA